MVLRTEQSLSLLFELLTRFPTCMPTQGHNEISWADDTVVYVFEANQPCNYGEIGARAQCPTSNSKGSNPTTTQQSHMWGDVTLCLTDHVRV